MSVLPATSPRSTRTLSRPLEAGTARGRALHVVPPTAPLPRTVGADLVVPTTSGPRTYVNLDLAASTPALETVQAAVDRTLQTYSSVHRGAGYASRVTSAWYEQARAEVGEFVGARDDDAVIFTRTTTDSWNLLSRALPRRTVVFVFASEHHSTLLPWGAHRTVRLPIPSSIEDALDLLDEAFAEHPARHRLAVVTAASNVTGEVWPVARFAALAHEHGARLAVDAAQLAPHRPVDLAGWDADYVAFSGHKTYAPFGAGVLAGRADWLDSGQPYLAGGGATRAVTERGTVWATGAARHEGGSPNVVGAVALAAACATIRAHRADIERHEAQLLARLRSGLETVPGVEQLSLFSDDSDRVGVVAFTVAGFDPSLVSQILSVEHGIGVRDGKFCAHLLVDELLEDPWSESPATAVRASLGLASTAEGVDRLVEALRELVTEGPRATWTHTAAGWVVEGDDPRDAPVTRPW
ncbi:MAG TPA: aminotransferase class V-fold PLP-dependent enzyme [Intrasporangium sp.]|uniref:aminotransferase class V-fold PLP-dependent enzyme n=1 Tax=Intrasporangium sp. TaxID=1925024 RepID=UPI002D79667F|nr:aminotransferase class V-fold PLP-dependent enzyme [Intrasporangium sp.]HET7397930.1 aminotransferase class V-fold PLP-dependent enzyme [Intrasporangium sp.]